MAIGSIEYYALYVVLLSIVPVPYLIPLRDSADILSYHVGQEPEAAEVVVIHNHRHKFKSELKLKYDGPDYLLTRPVTSVKVTLQQAPVHRTRFSRVKLTSSEMTCTATGVGKLDFVRITRQVIRRKCST